MEDLSAACDVILWWQQEKPEHNHEVPRGRNFRTGTASPFSPLPTFICGKSFHPLHGLGKFSVPKKDTTPACWGGGLCRGTAGSRSFSGSDGLLAARIASVPWAPTPASVGSNFLSVGVYTSGGTQTVCGLDVGLLACVETGQIHRQKYAKLGKRLMGVACDQIQWINRYSGKSEMEGF